MIRLIVNKIFDNIIILWTSAYLLAMSKLHRHLPFILFLNFILSLKDQPVKVFFNLIITHFN